MPAELLLIHARRRQGTSLLNSLRKPVIHRDNRFNNHTQVEKSGGMAGPVARCPPRVGDRKERHRKKENKPVRRTFGGGISPQRGRPHPGGLPCRLRRRTWTRMEIKAGKRKKKGASISDGNHYP